MAHTTQLKGDQQGDIKPVQVLSLGLPANRCVTPFPLLSFSCLARHTKGTSALTTGTCSVPDSPGSASIAEALTILGYRNVHHGIQAIHNPKDWEVFARACDAYFPSSPGYTGAAFTRADWDEVFGGCEAVTDMGSFWAVALTAAYPEAKVIVAERADVDAWCASMETAVFGTTWGWRREPRHRRRGPRRRSAGRPHHPPRAAGLARRARPRPRPLPEPLRRPARRRAPPSAVSISPSPTAGRPSAASSVVPSLMSPSPASTSALPTSPASALSRTPSWALSLAASSALPSPGFSASPPSPLPCGLWDTLGP